MGMFIIGVRTDMSRTQYLTPQELSYSPNGIENLFSGRCLDLNTMQRLSIVASPPSHLGLKASPHRPAPKIRHTASLFSYMQ